MNLPMDNVARVASLYLFREAAVQSLTDRTVLDPDATQLAQKLAQNADELVVFDLSGTDEEHEASLLTLRRICASCPVPVHGAGNVKRMEDIKKLLYAGCRTALLNCSKSSNCLLAAEVAAKFGRERIGACVVPGDHFSWTSDIARNIGVLVCLDSGDAERLAAERPFSVELIDVPLGMHVRRIEAGLQFEDLKKGPDGLVPVIVQESGTQQVLMLAYMNEEAYRHTLLTGRMTYFSRSRQSLWIKGETSGHYQFVHSLKADCDKDTLLATVTQIGAACHTGSHSCFFNDIVTLRSETQQPQSLGILEEDMETIRERRRHPLEGSYTNYLFDKGIDKMLKKLGEEGTEIIIAAKNPEPQELVYEISDYLYHLMVVMEEKGVDWKDISEELNRRRTDKSSSEEDS